MEKFKLRYSWLVYLVILPIIFILITTFLVLLYYGKIEFNQIDSSSRKTWAIYFIILIDLLVFLGVAKGLMMAMNLGCYYAIDSKGIIASIMYQKKKFLFSEIDSYYKLNQSQVGDLIYRINNSMLDFSNIISIKKEFDLNKTYMQLNKYSGISLPTASTDTNIGVSKIVSFPVYLKALKINPQKGEYILIVMKNGGMFILTPKKINEFYKLLPK